MKPILEMKGIDKSFNGIPVLQKIDFSLGEGQVVALVGGNGAGKSTLMKILTGVYARDSGRILLNGKSVNFSSYADANRYGLRMIFQELSLVPTLAVYENIFLNNEIRKGFTLDKNKMIAQTNELLESLGMRFSPNVITAGLDVGYQQMTEIAKALSAKAKILVLDEPTASLSDSEVKVLFETIRNLKTQGVSMVYISHRMNEILEISDQVTILKDGKVVADESAKNLTVADMVSHMLGGSAEKRFAWTPRKNPPTTEDMLVVQELKINGLDTPISFNVKKGEVVGIAGLMGSGRTEILETLFGIRQYTAGKIAVDGEEVKIKNVSDAVNAGIALVPEDRRTQGLVLTHTVKHNAILPVLNRIKSWVMIDEKRADAIVNEKVSELNVKTDSIHKTISLLSGGNQQKVVLGKWLSSEPKILLLDEPTAGIDIGAKGEITDIIRNFADTGNSVIMVSSELVEMMAVCDRIIILCDGKITGEYTRENIADITEEVLQNAIQG
ncbi:MAG: sugar ABC transporter ATP-binding protein [Defluviitaleaceae bacterium]|nr:sugar ABC transporter ATP-binding protein [Defluviitaleaceae bacterium]